MADPPNAATSRPDPQQADAGKDFGRLSRRIAGWTTNGLATGLILLAGLTLGRQVLIWWGQSDSPPVSRPDEHQVQAGPRQIELAALATTIRTQEIRGTRDDALVALRNLCRPAKRPGVRTSAAAGAAEQKLLAELSGQEPAERGDGWRLDQFSQGLPLVICSTAVERNSFRSQEKGNPENGVNSVPPSPADLRIVAVGLAVPRGENEWTAYAFEVDGAEASEHNFGFPLPPNSARGISLRQPDGSLLMAFDGSGSSEEWERHFRGQPQKEGWQLAAEPPAAGPRWQAQFRKRLPKPLRADVHFEYDGQGGLHGLLVVSPAGNP